MSTYVPISCEFHDVFEALATTRQAAHIRFKDDDGGVQARHTTVVDVFARQGEEFALLGTSETLRLDRFVSIGP